MEAPCHHLRSSLLIYQSCWPTTCALTSDLTGHSHMQPHMYAQHVSTEWQPHLSIDQVTGALRVLARAQAMRSALVGLLACPAPLLTAQPTCTTWHTARVCLWVPPLLVPG
jgi:hypothetical protein